MLNRPQNNQNETQSSFDACEKCPVRSLRLQRLGVRMEDCDFIIALAGNPNTGKSTVFNRLTGLRQHTGNWPGKTISRAEGAFAYGDYRYKIIDLPGTYSLLSVSPDEDVARDFLLFGKPDVTVVVVDATSLERNLNLVLQILQITSDVVVCLNLMDEAEAHGIRIDTRQLARELGVSVVPCVAREGKGIPELLKEIEFVAKNRTKRKPYTLKLKIPGLNEALETVSNELFRYYPDLPHIEWVALRLLEGDRQMADSILTGRIGLIYDEPESNKGDNNASMQPAKMSEEEVKKFLALVESLRWRLPYNFNDQLTEAIYAESERICSKSVVREGESQRLVWQQRLDRLLTSPYTAFPLMALLFCLVLWITIVGANYPSELLSKLLVDWGYNQLRNLCVSADLPSIITGIFVDGAYLATAWVTSVMLPPMAIFFPIFTILEDFGYLPRVAFNLDKLFQKVGSHGKQALTMTMGLGCNAAGVIATRIIDSPRERLIAIITNNFSLCNGRWPTQILISTVFIGSLFPAPLSGLVSALCVMCVALLGFAFAFLVSFALSKTILKGEASSFSLELPPYRPPSILRTLYTSLVDRTIFVLWRAVVFAFPAGIFIWLICNLSISGHPIAFWAMKFLDPLAWVMGLTGAVLLAYVVAIPANEIVIPATLMLTTLIANFSINGAQAGVLMEANESAVKTILIGNGWTALTAICLMLFSLCHNPCSTTLYTIYKETGKWRWVVLSTVIPLAIGFVLCSLVATIWRLF
ncbi:MAG TPA: ferrous iron transport protein B [Verrucomicrobiota bacterium]|nr:ferrous iron transport protein B [Verrucomicrobiota bacterium]